jgi:hypothetical protein
MRTTAQAAPGAVDPKFFPSFVEFYPFFLGEHANRTCRRLHFPGSSLALVCLALLLVTGNWAWLLAGMLCGYGCARLVGRFGFEKNRPASCTRPLYRFMGDWVMFKHLLTGRDPF